MARWWSAARPDRIAARERKRCSTDYCRVLRQKPLPVRTLSASSAPLPLRAPCGAEAVALVAAEMDKEEEEEATAGVGGAVHSDNWKYSCVGIVSAPVSD